MDHTKDVVFGLPTGVKIFFRFYAIVSVLGGMLIGIELVHTVAIKVPELIAFATGSAADLSSVEVFGVFSFFLAFVILVSLYGIGVYTFKRWVLPLTLIFSFFTLLIGFLSLLNINFYETANLVILLIGIVFMGAVGCAAIKYRSFFTGSARKLGTQIPLILVLLPFISFVTLSQIFTDDKEINDLDLLLQPIEILSQSDNAHYSLPNIDTLPTQQQQIYQAALGYLKETEGLNLNNQEAIDVTNQTKVLTDAVIEASSKSAYQCPITVNNFSLDAELCSLNDIRDLAILTAFRADVEVDTGNKDQAMRTAMSVVQLGSLIGNTEQPALIEYLLGIAVINLGLESLERTINTSATTSNATLYSIISDLEQSKIRDNTFADSLRREYMSLRDASKSFEQFGNYFYQHNKTLNQRAEIFRRGVAISSQGCDADTTAEQQELNVLIEEIRLSSTKWPIISPNFIGKVLNGVLVTTHDAAQKGCEVNKRNERIQELLQTKLITKLEE